MKEDVTDKIPIEIRDDLCAAMVDALSKVKKAEEEIKNNKIFELEDKIGQKGLRFIFDGKIGIKTIYVSPKSIHKSFGEEIKIEDYTLLPSNNDDLYVYLHNELLR
jgi:hypothetical protein